MPLPQDLQAATDVEQVGVGGGMCVFPQHVEFHKMNRPMAHVISECHAEHSYG